MYHHMRGTTEKHGKTWNHPHVAQAVLLLNNRNVKHPKRSQLIWKFPSIIWNLYGTLYDMIWYDMILYIYGNYLLSHGFLLGVFTIDTYWHYWGDGMIGSFEGLKLGDQKSLLATKQTSNVATCLQYLSLGIFL